MRPKDVWSCTLALCLAGCTTIQPVQTSEPHVFAPQAVIVRGGYGTFVTENLLALRQCKEPSVCAIALFNMGFVYAYPQSPYYDPIKALPYFNDLLEKYPQTSWAHEGQVWKTLITEKFTLEYENSALKQETVSLKQHNQTLEQSILTLEESQRRLLSDLQARDAIIRNLQERLKRSRESDSSTQDLLKRSRDIDMELEKKSRELLR